MDKLGIAGASLVPLPGKRDDKKKVGSGKTSRLAFRGSLKDAEESRGPSGSLSSGLTGLEKAEDLLDDVYQLGESLKQDGTLGTLHKYRDAVRKFYKFVVTHSLEAAQVEGRLNPKTMSRKQYTLISVIDEKLEKLGAAVIRSQKEQLELLKKIDEIYGILIDLTR